MKRLQATGLFTSPSALSIGLVVVTAALLLGAANMTFLSDTGLLQNTIFGSDSEFGLIETSASSWSAITETVLGNPILNKVLFFGFWMMIGLVVYAILTTVGQSLAEAGEEFESMKYVHARKQLIEQDLFFRLTVRAVACIGLLLLSWVFFKLVLPFSVIASRVWLNDLSTPINWLYGFLGLTVLLLALHIFVILLRLLVLRPRIFGGWDRFVD